MRKALDPGVEVPRVKKVEESPIEGEPKGESFYKSQGTDYYSTPTLANQWEDYPDTCEIKAPSFLVFDMMDSASVDAMNELYAQQDPAGAPRVIIIEESEYKSDTAWKIRVKYSKVGYKRLIMDHA